MTVSPNGQAGRHPFGDCRLRLFCRVSNAGLVTLRSIRIKAVEIEPDGNRG